MAFSQPLVLEGISVTDFVQYVLEQHEGPSILIVCGPKDAFLEQITPATAPLANEADGERTQLSEAVQPWTSPTLRLLSTSRTVKVAFCPDITHLRAYLATYSTRLSRNTNPPPATADEGTQLLAILNPIQLHRPTSAFSAQGLNRTFSAAVEAAYHSRSKLVIAECQTEPNPRSTDDEVAFDMPEQPEDRPKPSSSWDEEVSILNVTTKSFGAGERGWVGRTVKLRNIAGRWCAFQSLDRAQGD